ncbi:carotenoid oxygenase [Stachybotrys elegans]|uniref:Carotenoid oxygenase n=1 Tax=Stachybotrys elegans TaxID=80388 RepID=A0A8K0WPB1_9HYPO|nr:carotenoid oxygenase [Stachybotrys elegans]
MALNGSGVIRRTPEDEDADKQQTATNFLNESWKQWPNEAGFDGLEEHRGPLPLTIKGTIPTWAAGALYRTGPGLSKVEDTAMGTYYVSHWFDGFAHTHKFDIIADPDASTASVTYSSRRQSDDFVAHIKKTGWRSSISFAQCADPCVGLFAKAKSVFEPRHLNNSVTVHLDPPGFPSKSPLEGRKVFIGTDNTSVVEVHPDTLEPIGEATQHSLHKDLGGPLSCAHAQRDPETGDVFNFNLELGKSPVYRIFRVNAESGTTDILATVTEPEVAAGYIHSFFLTENYVVLCVPSSHYSIKGLRIVWERNLVDAMLPFDESKPCQWIVVDRRHSQGVVARFTTPPGFFFHSVNAFEEQTRDEDGNVCTDINLDYVGYDTPDIILSYYYDVILDRNDATKKHWIDNEQYKKTNPHLVRYRYRVSPQTDPCDAQQVLSIPNPHVGELPTINAAYACRPYRYVYSTPSRGLSTALDCIAKTDLRTREAVLWRGPQGHSPGEPVFVARPDARDEDDGVLLSVVLDGSAQRSYLLCLDARTMEEMGRAEADFAIGMGFHGSHASASR